MPASEQRLITDGKQSINSALLPRQWAAEVYTILNQVTMMTKLYTADNCPLMIGSHTDSVQYSDCMASMVDVRDTQQEVIDR